jgi:hypothetical protein
MAHREILFCDVAAIAAIDDGGRVEDDQIGPEGLEKLEGSASGVDAPTCLKRPIVNALPCAIEELDTPRDGLEGVSLRIIAQTLEVVFRRPLSPEILADQAIKLRDLRIERTHNQKGRGCGQVHLISRISFSLVLEAASSLPI